MIILILLLILLFIGSTYLFLVMPRPSSGPDLAPILCDYAHRGLFDNKEIPENSMAAFARAVEKGVGIELDLHLSADGRVVVFHDATLARMCGKKAPISALTWNQLKKERLLGTEQGIPLFEDVLKLVNGKVPLLIELKGEAADDALCWKLAPMLDAYGGEFCIESFNPLLLHWFVKHRPDMARGQLVTDLQKEGRQGSKLLNFALSKMLLNFLSRPDFIACDGKYRKGLALLVCRKLFRAPFFFWTVRKRELLVHNRRHGDHSIFEGFEP